MTPLPKCSAPAERALQAAYIDTLEQLATYTKREIVALHGVGPSVLRILETALHKQGLRFTDSETHS
ncbi:DNA-binding protein [Exiguobacterium sp. SL-9]|uniref:DNA-binding protein n=1 Tax=Exiguobacterium sp. SL-9 TaxID=2510963 RepID=UPI001040C0E3|nr:DNA-binding protein [Exiguobacterium sp. SL-9]TCI21420.1 DNA-binding protein [Exiguobacterium sp. SL-9]